MAVRTSVSVDHRSSNMLILIRYFAPGKYFLMSLKFTRQKDRHFLLSFFYKLDKLLPVSQKRKLKLYLDLEWIFERLAHEKSFRSFADHPVRMESFRFLRNFLLPSQNVLDLGCGGGDLSHMISTHTKAVVGVDHNKHLTEVAGKTFSAPNLKFISTDVFEFLKGNSDKFDVLILSHLLEHLEKPEDLIASYKQFFEFIYIEVPDFERSHLNVYRKHLNTKLIYSDSDHIWEFDREDMARVIRDTGLTIWGQEYKFGAQKYWCKTN